MDSKSILQQYRAEQAAKREQEEGTGAYLYLMRNGQITEQSFQPWKTYFAYLQKRVAEYKQYAEQSGTSSLQILKCSSPKGRLPFNPTPADFEQVEVLEDWSK